MVKQKVNVLISTYNGEKFIEQQIESILQQTYTNFHIYIRDDHSSDRTVQKIERFLNTGKVTIFRGDNIGFAQSFLELLKKTDEGSYWAFCDQDDIWMPDKLLWAVEWMEQQDLKKPCLFHSAFENVDGSLAYLSTYYPPQYQYTFQRALTECRYFGFSMVINGPLRELMLKGNPSNIVSHDWWAQLIAVAFGTCEFDSRVATKHRRHIESVTLDNKNRKIKWLKQSLKEGNKIANNADEFERIFGECISENEKYLLKLFTHKSIKGNFIRAFYFKRWRPTWISEITLRSLMLFGRS